MQLAAGGARILTQDIWFKPRLYCLLTHEWLGRGGFPERGWEFVGVGGRGAEIEVNKV